MADGAAAAPADFPADADDIPHMRHALALANRHRGRTGANPSVGCVLVKDGHIVARAVTALGGRPHAEAQALARAGTAAAGATAYVTLEPCAHEGATPACARLLAEAGIARLVVGTGDPDPRTAGRGIARLEAIGVQVAVSRAQAAARDSHRGFISRMTRGRPWVTLKLATSLDGAIASAAGQSQWITGPEARRQGWRLRAANDALLTGSETVLRDDPALDCRLAGLKAASPAVFVADRRGRFSPGVKLAQRAREGAVVTDLSAAPRPDRLDRAVNWCPVAADADAPALLAAIGAIRGINHLLIEAGGQLAAAFINADLVDEIAWFRAGILLGGAAMPALGTLVDPQLDAAPRFEFHESRAVGVDRLESWRRTG